MDNTNTQWIVQRFLVLTMADVSFQGHGISSLAQKSHLAGFEDDQGSFGSRPNCSGWCQLLCSFQGSSPRAGGYTPKPSEERVSKFVRVFFPIAYHRRNGNTPGRGKSCSEKNCRIEGAAPPAGRDFAPDRWRVFCTHDCFGSSVLARLELVYRCRCHLSRGKPIAVKKFSSVPFRSNSLNLRFSTRCCRRTSSPSN